MSSAGRVVLKARRARPFFAHHPWVFHPSIDHVTGDPAPGDEVDVVTREGQFIARGLYNPASTIRVRLYRWDDGPLDESFWSGLLARALHLRHAILGLGTRDLAYRVVFSEGDGFSGLTVDRYDQWLVAQFTSRALFARRELLLRLLCAAVGAQGIVARTERGIAQKEGLPSGEILTFGSVPTEPVTILENGLNYLVDLRAGPKTGYYLDQRANRRVVACYCQDKRVLDLFCGLGGFSLNAVQHGSAALALGIDSTARSIDLCRQHAAANGIERARFEEGDVLEVLDRLRRDRVRFDVVISDPPNYAREAKDVENALKRYLRVNQAALDVLEPDGILVACCCSGLVGRELFTSLIGTLAERSGRPIQILESRGQAPDHPVSASCLETDYLKCLICRVGARQ
jgi:23S rRNA (cytosine1962-C5)-methyltransferase